MRTRLVAVLIFSLVLLMETKAMSAEFLYSAKSNSDVIAWAKQRFFGGAVPVLLESDGKKYLVILGDNASGVTRLTILLYAFENKEWRLCLVRFTSNIDVRAVMDKDKKNLLIQSKDGTIILIQPLSSLKYEFGSR